MKQTCTIRWLVLTCTMAGSVCAAPLRCVNTASDLHGAATVCGTVKDSGGSPVAGATVWLASNAKIGTTSEANGNFRLTIPARPMSAPDVSIRPDDYCLTVAKSGLVTTSFAIVSNNGNTLTLPATVVAASGGSSAPTLTKGNYRDNRPATLVATFDDNDVSQTSAMIPLMDQYGYKVTIYAITDRVGHSGTSTWNDYKAALANGHEIGSHTSGHAPAARPAAASGQILLGLQAIQANLGVAHPMFAFPGGSQCADLEQLVLQTGHLYFRDSDHYAHCDRLSPDNILGCMGGNTDGSKGMTVAQIRQLIDMGISRSVMWTGTKRDFVIFYMHACPQGRLEVLKGMLDYIRSKDDQIWMTTNGRAILYEHERDNSALTVKSYGSNSVTFTILTTNYGINRFDVNRGTGLTVPDMSYTEVLTDADYNEPLTIVVPTTGRATAAWAIRAGSGVPVEVKIRANCLYVNTVPGADAVTVNWQ